MLCPNCQIEMEEIKGAWRYKECGLDFVWLDNITIFRCYSGCKIVMPQLGDAELLFKQILPLLVLRPGPLNDDAIIFLKKGMRLTLEKLALAANLPKAKLLDWERGAAVIDPIYDLRLRICAVNRVFCLPKEAVARDTLKEKIIFNWYPWPDSKPEDIILDRSLKKLKKC